MRQKPYFPQLIAALRESLEHLEKSSFVTSDDPTITNLKAAIVRTLAEYDARRDHPKKAKLQVRNCR